LQGSSTASSIRAETQRARRNCARLEPGTTFESVIALYDSDRKLRLLVLDAIERIEVAVRGSWAYQMAMRGGAFSYVDATHYADADKFNRNCQTLDREVSRSRA
jgi:abortive infection bacteriophage resistance protein